MKLYSNPAIYDLITCWDDQAMVMLLETLIPAGSNILDLGIGSGRIERMLAGRRHTFAGIDLSEEMVRCAKKNLPDARIVQGSFADASSYQTFAAGEFDAVFCLCNTLLYAASVEDLSNVLRLARYKSRPGAQFLVQTSLNVTDASIGKAKEWDAKVRIPNSFERVVRTQWLHARRDVTHDQYQVSVQVIEAGLPTHRMISHHRQLRLSADALIGHFADAGWTLRAVFDAACEQIGAVHSHSANYILEFANAP